MVTRRADHLFLVVNASCKDADTEHLRARIGSRCEVVPMPERATSFTVTRASGLICFRS